MATKQYYKLNHRRLVINQIFELRIYEENREKI